MSSAHWFRALDIADSFLRGIAYNYDLDLRVEIMYSHLCD